jgi:hypothetical protein
MVENLGNALPLAVEHIDAVLAMHQPPGSVRAPHAWDGQCCVAESTTQHRNPASAWLTYSSLPEYNCIALKCVALFARDAARAPLTLQSSDKGVEHEGTACRTSSLSFICYLKAPDQRVGFMERG